MTEEEEIAAIAALLSSPPGYGVALFEILRAYPLENGSFAVVEEDRDTREERERIFRSASEAAQALVTRRHEMSLGFDYEA